MLKNCFIVKTKQHGKGSRLGPANLGSDQRSPTPAGKSLMTQSFDMSMPASGTHETIQTRIERSTNPNGSQLVYSR